MKSLTLLTATVLLLVVLAVPAFAAPKQFSMRLTTDTPDAMPQGIAATWFGQEMQRRIPGGEAKVFNASSLMNNADSLEAMNSGTLEACWASMSKLGSVIPEVMAIRLPAMVTTYDQVKAIPKSEFGKYIEKAALAKKFVALGWGILSPYAGVAAKQRILTIDDWKGKKVRCYDKTTQVLEVKLAGGSPNVMSWGDFLPAVQSGVVDAGFTSLGSWGPVKETVPYFTCIGIVPDYYIFMVAKKWLDSLPAEQQAIVKAVAAQACAKQAQMQYENDMRDIEKFLTKDPSKVGVYLLQDKELEPYKKLWMGELEKAILKAIGSRGKEALDIAISSTKK